VPVRFKVRLLVVGTFDVLPLSGELPLPPGFSSSLLSLSELLSMLLRESRLAIGLLMTILSMGMN
jgi:hypothetical protein